MKRHRLENIPNNITTTSSLSRYRPEIEGLRAIAVVAVLINHFNKDLLPSGYLGVDIFFVISGFVITSSSNITIFNQFQFICPPNISRCTPLKEGIRAYRDTDHLNEYGSASLSGDFIDFLRSRNLISL